MSSRHTLAKNAEEAEFYRQNFFEFTRLELATGGPDQHLDFSRWMGNDGVDDRELAWRAGCYINPYVVISSAVLWSAWSLDDVLADNNLEDWLRQHWRGIPLRRERRAVRSPIKLAQCMREYATWVENELPGLVDRPYLELWESLGAHIKGFGRYASNKLCETFRRYGIMHEGMPDIRPAGAWSPRWTLSFLYPEHDELLNRGGDGQRALAQINEIAAGLLVELNERFEAPIDYFVMETLLCNYRQALEWRYPGRSHDSELAYYYKAEEYWGQEALAGMCDFFGTRLKLFPHECLGELHGWRAPRKELDETFTNHGYLWSDVEYDYSRTTDLARPAVRR